MLTYKNHDELPHFFLASHGAMGIGDEHQNWGALGPEVLHGISALLKMEQTEPRIKAFLKKDRGEAGGGLVIGVSLW